MTEEVFLPAGVSWDRVDMKSHLYLVLVLLAGGCAAGNGVATTEPVSQAQGDYDAVWGACLQVLRDYQFRVDRQDRREGLITTFPMTGKSWFELARKDAATFRDGLESSLQTIYRKAEVHITTDDRQTYRTRVRVAVSRSDRPYLQITNAGEAHGLFHTAGRRRRNRRAAVPSRPVPLPDDEGLAGKIQADIDNRLIRR